MELYDAIFYRKSTRKYSNKKVKEGLLEEVKNACSQITYLNKELDIKAHVVDRGHLVHFLMGKKCKVKAPHYIIVTSNKGNDYLQNIGFAMEEVVLKLTTLGLATCWLECNIKREDILELLKYGERITLECKDSRNEISKSVWETYSAFANTCGGTILLGIEEHMSETNIQKRFSFTDVKNPEGYY